MFSCNLFMIFQYQKKYMETIENCSRFMIISIQKDNFSIRYLIKTKIKFSIEYRREIVENYSKYMIYFV